MCQCLADKVILYYVFSKYVCINHRCEYVSYSRNLILWVTAKLFCFFYTTFFTDKRERTQKNEYKFSFSYESHKQQLIRIFEKTQIYHISRTNYKFVLLHHPHVYVKDTVQRCPEKTSLKKEKIWTKDDNNEEQDERFSHVEHT